MPDITVEPTDDVKATSEPKYWLITGGCGFIGTALIEHLVAEGEHTIRVIDNLAVGTRQDLGRICTFSETDPKQLEPLSPTQGKTCVELVVGDIMDEALALKVCRGAEVIVHLAANTGVEPSVKDPRQDCLTNVIGTFNYLEAARQNQVKRFVFASSGAPIGECEPPIHEELAPHPVSPYGASKLAGEGYCSAYYRTFGVETVVLRFGNVYGPGSNHKSSVVAQFIKCALAGEPLEIYGDGTQTRDFIYIDDLIDAAVKAATVQGIGGEIFQIASSKETTVNDLLVILLSILDECSISKPAMYCSSARIGDVKRNFSNTNKATNMLGWRSEASLEKGLQYTLQWYMQNQN